MQKLHAVGPPVTASVVVTLEFQIFFQAVKLDPATKKIQLSDGFELSYDKCLLATGGQPRNLPVFMKGSDDLKSRVSVFRKVNVRLATN